MKRFCNYLLNCVFMYFGHC